MKKTSGSALVLLFVVIASIQEVYLGNLFQTEEPLVVMFFSFLITLTFYLLFQAGNFQGYLVFLGQNFRNVAALNCTTTFSWIGLFVALKYMEPAVVGAICFTLGPVLTILFWKYLRKGVVLHQEEKYAAYGIAGGLVFILISSYQGHSGVGQMNQSAWLIGLVGSVASAFGVTGNTFFSKRLSEAGANTKLVMALRFPLLVFVGGAILPFTSGIHSSYLSFSVQILLFTLLTIIMPLFILQKGIERSEPITVSLLLSSIPIAIFLIQLLDARITPSVYTLLGVSICVLFASVGVLFRMRKPIRLPQTT